MSRSSLRIYMAKTTLFLLFAGLLVAGIVLSFNIAQWLSIIVPGRAQFYQYIVVILGLVFFELPVFWFFGIFLMKGWRFVWSSLLSPDEMTRLQESLRRL